MLVGRGKIAKRAVVVSADDFTVRGGAADAAIWDKLTYAEQMANELRLPIVRMIDGTGGGGSVKQLDHPDARTYIPAVPGFNFMVDNLSRVPVLGLALGPVAGLGAARVVMSHYSVMVRGMSQLFVAGPPVVAALGEHVDKETLGGSHMHARNGVVDDEVESEDEAFRRARCFLGYLPSSVDALPERQPCGDASDRMEDSLIEAIPRDARRSYCAAATASQVPVTCIKAVCAIATRGRGELASERTAGNFQLHRILLGPTGCLRTVSQELQQSIRAAT